MAPDSKARFRFPHIMLLYHAPKDRRRLLAPYLFGHDGRRDVVIVVPGEKESEGLARQVKELSRRPTRFLTEDSNEWVSRSRDPAKRFFELESETMAQLKGERRQKIQVGDWVHLMYGNVESLVEIEQGINDIEGVDLMVCCYRIDGLSSLDLRSIAYLVELHSAIAFRTSIPGTKLMTATYTSN